MNTSVEENNQHLCCYCVREHCGPQLYHKIQLVVLVNMQHPFISQAKPVTILRDLITEAMEMKAKRQQEQQRELEEEDDNSVRHAEMATMTFVLKQPPDLMAS